MYAFAFISPAGCWLGNTQDALQGIHGIKIQSPRGERPCSIESRRIREIRKKGNVTNRAKTFFPTQISYKFKRIQSYKNYKQKNIQNNRDMKTYKPCEPTMAFIRIHISCLIQCFFRTFLLNYTLLENGYIVYSSLQTLHGKAGTRNTFLERVWVGYYLRVKNKFSNGYMVIGFCLELIIEKEYSEKFGRLGF